MANFAIFTRADWPKFQKLILWLMGLPVRGTHIGGGIHVDMPETAPNPCPANLPGWTTRYCRWVAKPSNTGAPTDEFAVRLTQPLIDAWQAKKSQLTQVQRDWVQAHMDVATNIELVQAWKRTVQTPSGSVERIVEDADIDPEP